MSIYRNPLESEALKKICSNKSQVSVSIEHWKFKIQAHIGHTPI